MLHEGNWIGCSTTLLCCNRNSSSNNWCEAIYLFPFSVSFRNANLEHKYSRVIPCLRIGSCLTRVYRVMDARGRFGEHERSVRVARGAAESNSSFLSALQTSQVHPQLDIRTAKSMNQFFYNMATTTWALKRVLFLIDHN